jgi:excisionase family DNA binding protein
LQIKNYERSLFFALRREKDLKMSEDGFARPYRVSEAAERLAITDYQVRYAFRRGELAGFRIGRTILIRRESVDRLLRGDRRVDLGQSAA